MLPSCRPERRWIILKRTYQARLKRDLTFITVAGSGELQLSDLRVCLGGARNLRTNRDIKGAATGSSGRCVTAPCS